MSKPNRNPVLQFEHVERRPLRAQLDSRVLDDLDAYGKYILAQTGHEPTPDEIAEKALAKVFNSDIGFRDWQHGRKPESKSEARVEPPAEAQLEGRKARAKEAS